MSAYTTPLANIIVPGLTLVVPASSLFSPLTEHASLSLSRGAQSANNNKQANTTLTNVGRRDEGSMEVAEADPEKEDPHKEDSNDDRPESDTDVSRRCC